MTSSPRSISDPMDNKIALHTVARRYCEDRYSDWAQAYSDLERRESARAENKFTPGWDYSEGAYGIFPRYRMDKAIQVEIEKLVPQSCKNLEELRSQLISACDVAEARLHGELKNATASKALREEAKDYKAYIRVLRESDLANVAALPYRRVLTSEESKELRSQLEGAWDIGEGYWFPLREGPIPPNVLAFHVDYFTNINGFDLLSRALSGLGISRVFELHEFDPDEPNYEIELSIFKPGYRFGGEQYCTSTGTDWVVYASHESSIAIAGDWLTKIFKEKWPECAQRTYGGPFSTEDLRGTWKQE